MKVSFLVQSVLDCRTLTFKLVFWLCVLNSILYILYIYIVYTTPYYTIFKNLKISRKIFWCCPGMIWYWSAPIVVTILWPLSLLRHRKMASLFQILPTKLWLFEIHQWAQHQTCWNRWQSQRYGWWFRWLEPSYLKVVYINLRHKTGTILKLAPHFNTLKQTADKKFNQVVHVFVRMESL